MDRRFGLDKGFDHYDSPFVTPANREVESADLKRLGSEVAGAASQWIEKNSTRPFFVFLHLFDLHTPDNLPAAVRKRFPGARYTAEIGYVDEVLGNFFSLLAKQGLFDKALIVFTSDHGEGLGDHGENSHGFFIYQSTIAVPLIVRWPSGITGTIPRVDEAVGLLGIAPTILEVAGIPAPRSFEGKSLMPLARGQKTVAPEEVYSESFYGRNHFNTTSLLSLRKGRYKYIQAPKPEFYDLQTDPQELRSLWATQRDLAQSYANRVTELRRAVKVPKPQTKELSPEVLARLRSLGYLAGSASANGSAEPSFDPKDRIADYETYRRATTLTGSNRLEEANRLLVDILGRDPALSDAQVMLALNLQKLGQHDKAASALESAVKTAPGNVAAHYYLANSYLKLKKQDDAIKELQATLITASDRFREWKQITVPAEELLARLLLENKDYVLARQYYNHLLSVDDSNYEGHFNLAWLDARDQRLDDGIRHLQAAVKTRPADAPARNALGGLYLRVGRLEEAKAELLEATHLDPNHLGRSITWEFSFGRVGIKGRQQHNSSGRWQSNPISGPHRKR